MAKWKNSVLIPSLVYTLVLLQLRCKERRIRSQSQHERFSPVLAAFSGDPRIIQRPRG